MFIRRNHAVVDLTSYPVTKTDVFLLTLLEEPMTLSQLLDVAPGDRVRLEERVRVLVRLGLIEELNEPSSAHPTGDSFEDRVTLRPAAPPFRISFDDAVTLRPPPPLKNPFGDEEAATPRTGIRVRPKRSLASPFVATRARKV